MSQRRIIKSELNVEFAHFDWKQPSAVDEMGRSLDVAKSTCIERGWQFDSAVRSVLVDDKGFTDRPRAAVIEGMVGVLGTSSADIDFICFESDLRFLLPKFAADLVAGGGARQSRSLERYLDSHGRTACSHDIAIWHAFRLGLLGRWDELLHPVGASEIAKDRFYSRCVVSSVRREDMEYEAEGLQLLQIAYGSEIAQNVATIGYNADD
ncbi:MAG: hypothetical protein ABL931_02435 [Usitatibacteraceae bacterium]